MEEPLLPRSSNEREDVSSVSANSFNDVIKRQTALLSVSGLLAMVASGLGLVPFYVAYLISVHYLAPEGATSIVFYGTEFTAVQLALVAMSSTACKGVLESLSTWASHHAAFTILYDLRIVVAQKMGRLPLGYFTGRTTGELKKIMHEDIEMMELGLAHMIPDLVGGLSTPVFAGILLFTVSWKLTLATIASGAIGLGLFMWMMMSFSMEEFYALMEKMNGIVIQYVNGMKVVKAFTRTDFSFQQFSEVVLEVKQVYQGVSKELALPYAVMLTMMRSAAVTIVPTALWLFARGEIEIPTTILFVLMGVGFNQPLHGAMMHGGQSFHMVYTASKRITDLMDAKELKDPVIPKIPLDASLKFDNVSFGYKEDQRALTNVTLAAPAGKITALVGPSGSGKSTIAKLAARFWDVDTGYIKIGGVDVRDVETRTLMEHVSFVFQDVFLFNDTVANNIGIGCKGGSLDRITSAAKLAGCHDFIMSLPQGYESVIGENGLKLSGGQRQRLSIARAILKDSPIIILDEATAFLDPENEVLVQNSLTGLLKAGKTMIVVAHRLSTISGADQIVVMDSGSVLASGKHEDLLRDCPLYAEQWEAHNSAREWQFKGQAKTKPQLIGDLTEKDVNLENVYSNLNKCTNVVTQLRAFVSPDEDYLFVSCATNRAFESLAITFSYYVIYFVLQLLFDAGVPGDLDLNSAYMAVAALVASCAFQIWIGHKANLDGHKLMISVHSRLRLFLADYLRRLPMGYFTSNDVGSIDSLFTTTIMFMEPHHVLDSMVQAVVTPTVVFVFLFAMNWKMAMVALSSVCLSMIGVKWGEIIMSKTFEPRTRAQVEANSRMVEYIQGIAVIRAFNLTGTRLKTFSDSIDGYRDRSLEIIKYIIPALVIFKATLELGYGAFIILGSHLLEDESLSSQNFLIFLVLGHAFFNPIKEVAAFGEMYKIMQSSAKRIGGFLDTPLLPVTSSPESPQNASVEFEDVTFAYEEDRSVLNNVSFKVSSGSTVAFVGSSGSGKTTCASLLARFWDTNTGRIIVGGADVKHIPSNVLLNQLTMVFQDVYLFHDTVLENIRFGNPTATKEQVLAAAKAAQCHEFVSKLPDQYETMVGEGGATLSGGEKQRISIARALIKDSPVVVLDEATASLDPENERQIQLAIQALSEEKTLIVIAHRLTTIANCDAIFVFDEGNLVESGTHADLMKRSSGFYLKLWQARTKSQGWKIA